MLLSKVVWIGVKANIPDINGPEQSPQGWFVFFCSILIQKWFSSWRKNEWNFDIKVHFSKTKNLIKIKETPLSPSVTSASGFLRFLISKAACSDKSNSLRLAYAEAKTALIRCQVASVSPRAAFVFIFLSFSWILGLASRATLNMCIFLDRSDAPLHVTGGWTTQVCPQLAASSHFSGLIPHRFWGLFCLAPIRKAWDLLIATSRALKERKK